MLRIVFLFAVILSFTSAAIAAPAHIIILRHGEKVSDEERGLSPRGFQRAEALAKYFTSNIFLDKYGTPSGIFAASPGKKASQRSVETITPTAQAFNLPINADYHRDDGDGLMESVLAEPSFEGKTVIICWNRGGMSDLLAPLQGHFPRHWNDEIFDRFWILELQPDGSYSFKNEPQNLLPGDSKR